MRDTGKPSHKQVFIQASHKRKARGATQSNIKRTLLLQRPAQQCQTNSMKKGSNDHVCSAGREANSTKTSTSKSGPPGEFKRGLRETLK